jgi:hypothetical protein
LESFGNGVTNPVFALAFDSTRNILYVGGYFSTAGGINANYVAQWNATNSIWSPLGSGTYGPVLQFSIDTTRNVLYVGGVFTTAGGISANSIAQWNVTSSAWSSFSSGLALSNAAAYAVAVDTTNNILYAGGEFLKASSNCVSNIAQWNLTGSFAPTPSVVSNYWKALGLGVSFGSSNLVTTNTICLANNLLYVGGSFSSAGGISSNNIAQWNVTNSIRYWGCHFSSQILRKRQKRKKRNRSCRIVYFKRSNC